MTFSILARCPKSRMMGMAISSSSPAVGARCAHARAGIGLVATQNITDPRLGPAGLDLMARGSSAQSALDQLCKANPYIEHRQLLLLDATGEAALFSGRHCLGRHALAKADGVAAAGNLLANEDVPEAMIEAFLMADGSLGKRLIDAMKAGLKAGGEAGPVHSSSLLLVRDVPWPVADLRVDWCDHEPIDRLARLWHIYEPQLEAYIDRALDPGLAPRFGVPGDE